MYAIRSYYEPEALNTKLSHGARRLLEQAFADVDPGRLRDSYNFV